MRMITVNVDEHVYNHIKAHAEQSGRSASELIREAMAEYESRRIPHRTSIFDSEPSSVGRVLRDLSSADDILNEMLS